MLVPLWLVRPETSVSKVPGYVLIMNASFVLFVFHVNTALLLFAVCLDLGVLCLVFLISCLFFVVLCGDSLGQFSLVVVI